MQRIFRAASLALALSLGLVNGVDAGPSAGAAITQTSAATVAGIGPGEQVSIDIDIAGIVDAKNVVVTLQVSNPAACDMASMGVAVSGGLSGMNVLGAGTLVSGTTDQLRQGAADLFGT